MHTCPLAKNTSASSPSSFPSPCSRAYLHASLGAQEPIQHPPSLLRPTQTLPAGTTPLSSRRSLTPLPLDLFRVQVGHEVRLRPLDERLREGRKTWDLMVSEEGWVEPILSEVWERGSARSSFRLDGADEKECRTERSVPSGLTGG